MTENTSAQRDQAAAVARALMARDIMDVRDEITAVSVKVDKVSEDVAELVALFKGAKAVVNIVKWIGGIAGGIGAIWAAISHFWPVK